MKKADNYFRAYQNLIHAVQSYHDFPENDLYRDALIQRFEFTTELAWKAVKEYMEDQGFSLPGLTPKSILKEAFAAGIIQNETVWMQILKSRNMTSHIDDEATAISVANLIIAEFIRVFHDLQTFLLNQKTNNIE